MNFFFRNTLQGFTKTSTNIVQYIAKPVLQLKIPTMIDVR